MTKVDEEKNPGASLGDRRLGLAQAVAQALGTTAPVFGALTFLPLVVGGKGIGAGGAAPLSVLLSAVAAFGVAWTLSRFSRQLDNTGSCYVYISRSFGDRAGTAFGSLNYFSIVFGPITPLIFDDAGGPGGSSVAKPLRFREQWSTDDKGRRREEPRRVPGRP